jgi:hypothetical protein
MGEVYAFWRRVGFFAAIVFRPLPHDCGICWPLHGWEISRSIYDFWMRPIWRERYTRGQFPKGGEA